MKKRKLLYCFIVSFLFLFILTKSSPLYKINDWYDAQCFFTVGKSMMNGIVPYVDLFEQKGPLLFFIYGIASLFSIKSFIGVFILEVISYTVFLYYITKIIEMFIDKKYSYIILPILSMLILSSRSFTAGGSCEEFCFPFLAVTLYYFIKYLKSNKLSNKEALIIGIMSGCIFWMKYTLLGFSVGFCIILLIKKIKEKEYIDLLYKILYFLLGILITSIPWIIYFGIHKAGIKKLIDTYFLFNINSYAEDTNLLQKIINCFNTISKVLIKYYQYIILIFIPMLFSIKSKIFFKKRLDNFYLLFSSLLLLVLIFIGGTNYRYYSLPIQLFMVFGLIYIVTIINKLKIDISKYILPCSIISIIICLLISYYHSPNTEYIKKGENYYAQFIFKEKIEKNKTILNYGFLDGGFYFTTNTYPNIYYFQRNNIKYYLYPNNMDEQNEYLRKGFVDYVITRNLKPSQKQIMEKNYELIMTHKQKYEGKNRRYSLYRRKYYKKINY